MSDDLKKQVNDAFKAKFLLSLDNTVTLKRGTKRAWDKTVRANTNHPYASIVLHASIEIMSKLQVGAPPEIETETMREYGLTGFQAGVVASMVVQFSPRGDEFKEYWNRSMGAPEAMGVVNPALLTIREAPQ